MQIVRRQEVSFDIGAGYTWGAAVLSGFTNLSKMVPIAVTWRVKDGQSPVLGSNTEIDVDVGNVAIVYAYRWSSSPTYDINITVTVVEFGDDTTVYKGTWAMTDAETSTTASIGGTVTLANTFGNHHRKNEGEASPSNDSDPDGRITKMKFNSTTQLGFARDTATGACEGHWHVVESDTLTVEHVTHTITSDSSTSTTKTITSVTMAEAFVISSYLTDSGDYNDEGCWTTDISAATTLRMRRRYGASVNNTWEAMIVSDSNITVQRGDWTTSGATTDNTSITAVDLDVALVKSGAGSSGFCVCSNFSNGHLDRYYSEMWFNSSTQINREVGDTPDNYIEAWEVVELEEGTPTSVVPPNLRGSLTSNFRGGFQ